MDDRTDPIPPATWRDHPAPPPPAHGQNRPEPVPAAPGPGPSASAPHGPGPTPPANAHDDPGTAPPPNTDDRAVPPEPGVPAGGPDRPLAGMPARAKPVPGGRWQDPLAVAVGNASLLGAGYLMLGRRLLAAATGLVTVVLLVLLVTAFRTVWFEVLALAWWAALVAHGWYLARGGTGGLAVRRQRLVALYFAVPVLLTAGFLRFDAATIGRQLADARRTGDCGRAAAALDRIWFGDRVLDAPLTVRGDGTRQACRRLATARERLRLALAEGDTHALGAGFAVLAGVLADLPGHDAMVDVALDGFLARLPTDDACHTAAITDWLRARRPDHTTLDRSAGVVGRTAPAALLGCGDAQMAAKRWTAARSRYQELLDRYPDDPRAGAARTGVREATLAIELATVRRLLEGPRSTQPEYCSHPAKYSGAKPFGTGTNRALFYGNSDYTDRLPARWRATDPTNAVLVVCADDDENGTSVQTCPYQNKAMPDFPVEVTFHKIAIPVRAYELRTGRLVAHRTLQIGGSSCPQVLHYTSYVRDLGPPSDVYVHATTADIRAAFSGLVNR